MCYFEPVMIASVVRVSEKSGRKVIVRNKSSHIHTTSSKLLTECVVILEGQQGSGAIAEKRKRYTKSLTNH